MPKRTNAPVGLGRLSASLGTADPRRYRNAQQQQSPELNLGKSLRVDKRGKLEVSPSRSVASLKLGDALTLEDVAAKLNEILAAQRDSGQMKGGI